jgi:O-antigen/teichoic acid export membrane protein
MMVSLPLTVGLVTLARPIVLGLFGDQWVDSISAMQILSVYAFMVTIGIPAGTVFKATGRAGILLALAVARFALVFGLIAAVVDRGIDAVAIVQAGAAFLNEIVGLALASHFLKVSARSLWRSAWPSLAAASLMAPPMIAAERFIQPNWPAMIVGGLAGAVVYLGAMALISPESIRYLRQKMFPGRLPPSLEADMTAPATGQTDR